MQIDVEWIAPVECPSEADARRAVAGIRGPSDARARLTVHVARAAGGRGYVAHVAVATARGTGEQEIRSAMCEDFVQAVAVIAALAVDPGSPGAAAVPDDAGSGVADAGSGVADAGSGVADAGAGFADAGVPAASGANAGALEPRAQAGMTDGEGPAGGRDAGANAGTLGAGEGSPDAAKAGTTPGPPPPDSRSRQPSRKGPRPRAEGSPPAPAADVRRPGGPVTRSPGPAQSRPSTSWTPHAGALLLAAGELGVMPAPDAGVLFGATLRAGPVEAEVSGVWMGAQSATLSPRIGGDFSLWEARALACGVLALGPADVAPCAGLGIDWMRGTGFGAPANAVGSARWLDGILGGHVTIWLARFVGVTLQVEAAFPFARPTFALQGLGSVHHPAPEFGGAEVGPEVLF